MNTRPARHARAFSLVEAVLCTVIVATMFMAGMAATGSAARDRVTRSEMRTGQQLARMLMTEIIQQRYVDPSPGVIDQAAGASTTDRSNWTHISDYNGLRESPRDRSGVAIPGSTGWKWEAAVSYQSFPTFAGVGNVAASGSGVVGGLLGVVSGTVGAVLGADSAADTGLKRIVVTVTSPRGKVTTLTSFRSNTGAVDRVSTTPGFRTYSTLSITTGADARPVTVGTGLLNTPPMH